MLNRREVLRSLKHRFYSVLARLLIRSTSALSLSSRSGMGEILGALIYLFDGDGRRVALDNLRRSFPHMPLRDVRRICRKCYANMGKNVAEFAAFTRASIRREILEYVEIRGLENLEKALARGRGVVLLTAHFGNWELLGGALGAAGYPINGFVRTLRIGTIEEIVSRHRSSAGFRPLAGESGLKNALIALRRNELLGILADIDTSSTGEFVDFFGRRAYTPIGPILIAARTGASVVPAFIVRCRDRHRLIIGREMELSGNPKLDMQSYTYLLEKFVRRYTAQWIWMHRRWRNSL